MKMNNVDFETYFKNYPDANGYFGKYGGVYTSPELQEAMVEITEAYQTICKSRKFINELRLIRKNSKAVQPQSLTWHVSPTKSAPAFSFMLSAKT